MNDQRIADSQIAAALDIFHGQPIGSSTPADWAPNKFNAMRHALEHVLGIDNSKKN